MAQIDLEGSTLILFLYEQNVCVCVLWWIDHGIVLGQNESNQVKRLSNQPIQQLHLHVSVLFPDIFSIHFLPKMSHKIQTKVDNMSCETKTTRTNNENGKLYIVRAENNQNNNKKSDVLQWKITEVLKTCINHSGERETNVPAMHGTILATNKFLSSHWLRYEKCQK